MLEATAVLSYLSLFLIANYREMIRDPYKSYCVSFILMYSSKIMIEFCHVCLIKYIVYAINYAI